MDDLEAAGSGDVTGVAITERTRPRSYPRTIRKPLIAAINGAAVGLGLVEALYCDLRFATPSAALGPDDPRRGGPSDRACRRAGGQ